MVAMTTARFDELVSAALDDIPVEFARQLDNVVILVEDENETNPHLFGLYHGVPLTARTSQYGGVLPDRIFLYRKMILDYCRTEQEVIHQVKVTVVHEIGHHFGIDDATLHQLGWA